MGRPAQATHPCPCGLEKRWTGREWRCNPCRSARKRNAALALKTETAAEKEDRVERHRLAALLTASRSDRELEKRHDENVARAKQVFEEHVESLKEPKPPSRRSIMMAAYWAWEQRWREPVRGLMNAT